MLATPMTRRCLRTFGFLLVLLAAAAVALSARVKPAQAAHSHFDSAVSAPAVVNSFGDHIFGIAAGGDLQNETPATLGHDLDQDQQAGGRWIRVDVNWAQIQAAGPDSFDWTNLDRVVQGAESRGMSVLGTIDYTPSWARPAGTQATWGPKPADYAAFAQVAARHLSREGVHALEIWNEENITTFWTPHPDAAAYTAMLKAADTAIKRVAPHTTVITGGTAPAPDAKGTVAPVTFLQAIYRNGGQGHFDAVGHHPYCWPAYPGAKAAWSAWYQMYGTPTSLRSLMVAHGDGAKKIWATEFGAPTGGPRGSYVSDTTQAKMVSRAYDLFASYSWAGPLFLYQGRDAGGNASTIENFFGFINHNFTPKPAFRTYQRLSATL